MKKKKKRGKNLVEHRKDKKTVSSALWIQITLVVCYLPFAIVATIFYRKEMYTPLRNLSLEAEISLVYCSTQL